MAEALSDLGCEVLFLECGGEGRRFAERTHGLARLPGGAFAHPERDHFYVARASRLPGMRYSFPGFVRRVNERLTSRRAERFLAGSGGEREVAVLHYGWYFPSMLAGLRGARTVYECLDDHAAAPQLGHSAWSRRYIRAVEAKLLARAEVTVFSSPALAATRGGAARRAEVIPLGVDAEHFGRAPGDDPHQTRGIGSPRAGFVGLVTARSDWRMLARAAELMPDWQWVVVGPLVGVEPRGPANLRWIGAVPYEDLPGWLATWDVGLVPMADTDFNRASWPLKFYEYLAAGTPAASTPIPAARALADATGGLVVPAAGWRAEDLVDAVVRAASLRGRARTEGRAFAARHSWTARAGRVLNLLG